MATVSHPLKPIGHPPTGPKPKHEDPADETMLLMFLVVVAVLIVGLAILANVSGVAPDGVYLDYWMMPL